MNITRFFKEVLHAPLANARWSWGAIESNSNRVFLRVWKDQVEPHVDGERVQVNWNHRVSKSLGYDERSKQVEALRKGAQGIGILCDATDPQTATIRKIARFNEDLLLELGELSEDERGTFARIVGRISIKEISSTGTVRDAVMKDILEIFSDPKTDITTKESLVAARIGQGAFRSKVLGLWNNRCAVTGSVILNVIRASHIKPWSVSSNRERLDSSNGLPLVAGIDALFDAGLISFEDSGRMIVSQRMSPREQAIHATTNKALTKKPSRQMATYLRYHRDRVFIENRQGGPTREGPSHPKTKRGIQTQ